MSDLQQRIRTALLTADADGYLMPSDVHTEQSADLVAAGLAALEPMGAATWERLTPAGKRAAELLRPLAGQLAALTDPSPAAQLRRWREASTEVSRFVQWDHGGDDAGSLRTLGGVVIAEYWQRSPDRWAWRLCDAKPMKSPLFADYREDAITACTNGATAAGWQLVNE